MRSILYAAGLAVGLTLASGTAHAACELRYAAKVSEVTAKAQADIRAESLKGVSQAIDAALGDKATVQAKIGGRYSVAAAGGLAEDAYAETVSGMICSLKEKWAGDPAKVAKLDAAERAIVLTLNDFFDVGLWQVDQIDARRQVRRELEAAKTAPPLFPLADVESGLPKPNFDVINRIDLTGGVEVPGVVAGKVCAGFVKRSIRKVDPSILAQLGRLRSVLVKYLAGDQASARIDLWIYASTAMNRQLSQAAVTEEVTATPAFLACVDEAKTAAVAASTALAAQPGPTT